MTDATPRLVAVRDDIQNSLQVVLRIVEFVEAESRLDPDIRVAIFNSMIVSLVSIIEEGIRALFAEYIGFLEDSIGRYDLLRRELTAANLESAAELLKEAAKGGKADAGAVTRDLLSCLTGERGYKLFKAGITYNRSNMRSKVVTELAKRLGFTNLWQSIGEHDEAKALFPELANEQVSQSIVEMWNALFDERDTIVHRISQANGWGETRIAPYISFFEAIVNCIVSSLAIDAKDAVEAARARVATGTSV